MKHYRAGVLEWKLENVGARIPDRKTFVKEKAKLSGVKKSGSMARQLAEPAAIQGPRHAPACSSDNTQLGNFDCATIQGR